MDSIIFFYISIKNEILKLKRTFAFWMSIISAFFIPTIYMVYYLLKYDTLIPTEGENPWAKFMIEQIISAASLLIPLFIVLITSLIIQIEHKSSGIKHLFSLPIPKWSVYYGKLIVVLGMILFTYAIFFIIMLIIGTIVGWIHPELNFLSFYPEYELPLKLLFRSFVAVLGILGIQFWLSFKIKNFIIPLSVGMVLVITGLIIYEAKESIYFPYSYNRWSLFSANENLNTLTLFPKVSLYSLGYFILASILGYIDIKQMDIK